jgi:hypothetical protein
MLISRWIDSLTGQQRMVEDLTKRIAARCEPIVWARVQDTAQNMDPAESRGYIRARAALVVNREVQIATQSLEEVSDSLIQRVTRNVSDTLVRTVMSTIAVQHPADVRRAA